MVESDQREVEGFYQTLSNLIRVHGAEHLARQYVVIRADQIEATGPLDFSNIQRVWPRPRRRRAQLVSGLARRGARGAGGRGAPARRGQDRLRGGHVPPRRDLPSLDALSGQVRQRAEGGGSACRARYRLSQGRRLLNRCPIEPVEIPFEGTVLPGYLHLPDGEASSEAPPCVIMVNGADSVKKKYPQLGARATSSGAALRS